MKNTKTAILVSLIIILLIIMMPNNQIEGRWVDIYHNEIVIDKGKMYFNEKYYGDYNKSGNALIVNTMDGKSLVIEKNIYTCYIRESHVGQGVQIFRQRTPFFIRKLIHRSGL